MKETKLKYCDITNHIHLQLLDEELLRTGSYQWLNVFKGKIYPAHEILPTLKDGDFDIIRVNMSAQDINLINTIREKIGNNSKTKLVVNNDYTTEMWQSAFQYPETMRRELAGADMLFGTEYYQCTTLKELTGRDVYEIPHPAYVKRLKVLSPKKNTDFISVVWHRYDKFSYIPYFAVRNHNCQTRLIGFNPKEVNDYFVTEALYDDIAIGTNYLDFCDQSLESKLVYDPFTYHSYGRTTVDTAALGVPVVGSNRVESIRRCYPHTCVDPYDTTKARELIYRILNDNKFKELVIETAQKEVEYYGWEQSKKRYLNALYNETKDERFKLEV
jgi:hypothetical protein